MLRVLKFMLIAALLLALAWWVGTLPGDVTAHSGAYTVQTSVPAALLLLFLIALFFTLLLRVLGGLRRAPGEIGAWRGGRRAKLGEAAVQRALVALAAEDAPAARAEAGRARKLLGDTPMALLVSAEAARLSGDEAQTQAAFKLLSAHPQMGFLGHHGLLRHSFAMGDHDAAQAHALAAEAAYPGSPWLKAKRFELAVREGKFAAALGLTRAPAEVAALATAAAQRADNPQQALAHAKQAVKADPTLAPAILALAKALHDLGKLRAGQKALLAGWRAAPNPLLAQAYLAAAETPIARAQAAAELGAQNPGHVESELILAQTALEARLTGEARRHAEAALAAGAADGRAQAILATLEGHPAPARPRPGWVCTACHGAQAEWTPTCPDCHKTGSLQWRGDTAPA
ncbi:MAG: hypothetical protein B7X08_06875 [Acidocella sp. 20-63-7]|nr:MAG: hypothetical protein B7X08_06875 [Acidocella sp. 20-63-7]HQT45682.1 heme biosynthesis HemY N-terminal domain-containing protein [Acidocella sp.]